MSDQEIYDILKTVQRSHEPKMQPSTFVPSEAQQNIFDWTLDADEHGIINACAGSGKSTTLIENIPNCMKARPGKILAVTFTTLAAESFTKKVPMHLRSEVHVSTFNAFGWRVCRDNVNGVKLDKYKDDNILKSVVDPDMDAGRYYRIRKPLLRMVSLLKALNQTPKTWEAAMIEYGVEMGEIKPMDRFADALNEVYWKSVNQLRTMSFGDQIFQPIYRNWAIPAYSWALIDELQDSTPVDLEMARRIARNGRILGVGDPDQCQPPGTMVTIRSKWNDRELKQVAIETLRRGDEVVSMQIDHREWRINPILDISARPYNGEMIVVTTSTGETSRYTPNHRCVADFSMLRDQWCIYLMRRKNQFRVGKSVMCSSATNGGLYQRMRIEGATEGWILSVHDTSQDAWVAEQIASIQFNLPQTTFRLSNGSMLNQTQLDKIWRAVGDNTTRAEQCLEAHGRRLEHPLVAGDLQSWVRTFLKLRKVRACNLLDGCQMVTLDWQPRGQTSVHNRATPSDFRMITIKREHYEGLVYSLSVQRDQSYVADGLATLNSIFLFRGSHPDAMGALADDLGAAQLPLSTCYRCPDKVIESAKKQVPRITAPVPNPRGEGILEWITSDEFRAMVKPGDVVLSRTTAPLVKRCLQDIRDGRRAYVKGRDVGEGLLALIERIHGNQSLLLAQYNIKYNYKDDLSAQWDSDIELFLRQVSEYFVTQSERLNRLGYEMELINLDANVETIKVLAENCDYVVEIIRRIEEIFDQPDKGSARAQDWFDSAITYMSMHRCKGLEFDRVFILRADLLPHPKATSEKAKAQDKNLLYVAKTRAMKELYFIRKDKGEK